MSTRRSMLYLFYTDKRFLIDKEIKKLTKNFNEIEIVRYDLNNNDIKEVLDDASTVSMFGERKLIIADNAVMFTPAKSDNALLEGYLNKYNPDTTLVFIVNDSKIDSRKKITKLIKSNGIIKDFSEDLNPNAFVKKLLEGYSVTSGTINLLIERVGSNFLTLENEVNKLKLYKEDKTITDNDVLTLTVKTSYEDIFKLIDYIVSNDKEKALEVYRNMKNNGEEDIKIIILLANQFRILYQTKRLLKKGLSEKVIADTLKIHPYRVKLAAGKSRSFTENSLLNYLSDLADIDYGIKSGSLNKDLALEMFILKK